MNGLMLSCMLACQGVDGLMLSRHATCDYVATSAKFSEVALRFVENPRLRFGKGASVVFRKQRSLAQTVSPVMVRQFWPLCAIGVDAIDLVCAQHGLDYLHLTSFHCLRAIWHTMDASQTASSLLLWCAIVLVGLPTRSTVQLTRQNSRGYV